MPKTEHKKLASYEKEVVEVIKWCAEKDVKRPLAGAMEAAKASREFPEPPHIGAGRRHARKAILHIARGNYARAKNSILAAYAVLPDPYERALGMVNWLIKNYGEDQ